MKPTNHFRYLVVPLHMRTDVVADQPLRILQQMWTGNHTVVYDNDWECSIGDITEDGRIVTDTTDNRETICLGDFEWRVIEEIEATIER